ncbi:MAG TPA: methyltransferase [Aquifex aeolicus]|nr:methyltransferase [Aquifex aeolicus]
MAEITELKESSYVRSFKKLRIANLFEKNANFRKLRRKNTFWKEISEAMAVRERIKDYLIKDPSYIVIDVCSGKGFLSTIVGLMHPKTKILAVDRDKEVDREHFNSLKNVEFVNMDIMSDDFYRLVKESGQQVILTGIHLCRELSERFIDLVNSCENVKAAVLMPCCEGKFPRKKYQFLIDELGVYEAWCYYLKEKFDENLKVKMKRDKKVLSPKNIVLTAERNG